MTPQRWWTIGKCLRYDMSKKGNDVGGNDEDRDESEGEIENGCHGIQDIVKCVGNEAWTMGNHWELTEISHLLCNRVWGRDLDDDDEHGGTMGNEWDRHLDDRKCVLNEPWMEEIRQEMMEIWHDSSEGAGGGGMPYLNIGRMDLDDRGVVGKA